ncbi:crossover junction endodeoxyribonuclease RuvC [Acidaminococcus fermentans]|uniref:Crossover junction endodeoxyribonuclease RuvC n=2 Tax=Acidaminococcus fermentans TaxID=905 RepID=D2RLD6_ACIFV|nr:crossover junction endodeoxyribonuclease RuvC [Acidaminococcus fermentans]ADB47888.1 crossover junction endodeoxyribonuclease RuvC [Acidaminococcus fermentans DSM 20731]MCF0139167.1 crossover junction endodeoxyribonuclease RuvC [Acidaminococcus fermentans]MCI6285528.1 crossover junction endodeoxyribonuclease RuvC [Acidaminococcus fermentans]MCI7193806.1 crossover junction endodeoxyribonuclease RuvC [Acidaminococcus fermentans]MDD6287605.1 crossover junction endodeoxyribonuclease RuvC [Acida
MLALGIDPGTAICGYGLVRLERSRLIPVHYGAVFTDKDMLPERRLNKIYEELTDLIDRYHPDFMSVEKLFFNRNVTTAIAVGEARGVILLTAARAGIPVYGYTPIQVKQAITGTGRANKEQVTYMVQKLLHIEEKPKPDDVADALAIGITGLNFIREQELQERMR